ncbi:MAG: hypothetical protein LAO79_29825 [Acidobacteriia bacterium]|nr:hypothetical protein [Terriglobia bacterium]
MTAVPSFRLRSFIALAAVCVPLRADLNQDVTLSAGSYVNLDTGTVSAGVANSPDLRWVSNTLNPVGTAKILNLGIMTASSYQALTQSDVQAQLANATNKPLPATSVVANDVFIAMTNKGSASKVLIDRAAGGLLIMTVTTYGAVSANAPVITSILNNSSRIASTLPNGGIAPSSLFVVIGKNLADAGTPVLQSTLDPGLPLVLNGASLSVTVGATTVYPALYYTSPTQLAAVMPANIPPGTGTLTASYNGVPSAPASIKIVTSAVGLNIYNSNTGVATDAATGALVTFANSAAPGQTIVLWATGLGADPGDSDTTYSSSPQAVNTPLQIYFGATPGKILYQGSSGYPGVNQINVVVPSSVSEGCWISVAAVTGTVVSNVATLPIRAGGGPCIDPKTGLDGSRYFTGGNVTYRAGFVSVFLSSAVDSKGNRTVSYGATGDFARYTVAAYDPVDTVSPGGCILRGTSEPVVGLTALDAGAIQLTGPGGLNVALPNALGIKGSYSATLPDGAIPPTGGTFTFTGNGGNDVGKFSGAVTLSDPILTWTNSSAAATVTKSSGLTVTWTGGTPGSYVEINGEAGPGANSQSYTCIAHVEDGKFTVPSYILQALPDATNGATEVSNQVWNLLSASGVDFASVGAGIGYTVTTNYTSSASR